MKIVIFAGGTGRRLWPISRKKSPKQFEPIIGSKSTLQLAVERVLANYGAENIYISTNEMYRELIQKQLGMLPAGNIIGEPVRRDLAPAVGLAMTHLAQVCRPDETVCILWGDNYMSNVPAFLQTLETAEQLITGRRAEIVFMGETPRFANENLGWIGLGPQIDELNGQPCFTFTSWHYRPAADLCQQMFESGRYVWNTGYFMTTIGFVRDLYRQHQPAMADSLEQIGQAIGQSHYQDILNSLYPSLPSIHFDDAILTHVGREQALVLHHEMGWSDPGTLYALKEALNPDTTENVTLGQVLAHNSRDGLFYNYDPHKLMAVVGLDGAIVVNTEDAILVTHKAYIPLVKKLVDGLEGTELEKYS